MERNLELGISSRSLKPHLRKFLVTPTPTLKVDPQSIIIKKPGEYYLIMSNYNSNYELTNKRHIPSKVNDLQNLTFSIIFHSSL